MAFKRPLSFSQNSIITGIIIMLCAQFMFSANDAMGKWLMTSFTVAHLLLIRSIGAFIVLGPMLTQVKPSDIVKPQNPWLILLRGLFAAGDTGLFYAAVQYLLLTDVITFYMAIPIYITAFSHFFLGERIGWRRWLAILIGFMGVIIAMRPSSGVFSIHSLFALGGSLSFTMVWILGRTLRSTSDTVLVTWQTVIALLIGAYMIIGHWAMPTPLQWLYLLLLGIVSCIAHLLISRALKMAPASVLAPLQYTLLLWGIIFDILVFKHYPDHMVLIGGFIIVGAGLFIFHRKKVVEAHIPKSDVSKIRR